MLVLRPDANPANIPAVEFKEAIVQRNDMVSYSFLLGGSAAGTAVAQLQVPRHENGVLFQRGTDPEVHQGTGWLVTPDLIVTNHHVVNARRDGEGNASAADLDLQTRKTKLLFDFDEQSLAGNTTTVAHLEVCDPVLDFAILLASLRRFKPLLLNPDRIEITKESYVVRISFNTYGGPKKAALRNNLITTATFLTCDISPIPIRFSGSPVFNDSGQVALHRSSTFVKGLQFQGRAGWVNEGTHILAILDYVRLIMQKCIKRYQES